MATRRPAPTPDLASIRSGLVIEGRWLDLILSDEKTWEMRSQSIHKREWIALIRKGSKTIVGVCRTVGVHGPLSFDEMRAARGKHCIPPEEIEAVYKRRWTRGWELDGAHKLEKPIPYQHKRGTQSWVTLNEAARALLRTANVTRAAEPLSAVELSLVQRSV